MPALVVLFGVVLLLAFVGASYDSFLLSLGAGALALVGTVLGAEGSREKPVLERMAIRRHEIRFAGARWDTLDLEDARWAPTLGGFADLQLVHVDGRCTRLFAIASPLPGADDLVAHLRTAIRGRQGMSDEVPEKLLGIRQSAGLVATRSRAELPRQENHD